LQHKLRGGPCNAVRKTKLETQCQGKNLTIQRQINLATKSWETNLLTETENKPCNRVRKQAWQQSQKASLATECYKTQSYVENKILQHIVRAEALQQICYFSANFALHRDLTMQDRSLALWCNKYKTTDYKTTIIDSALNSDPNTNDLELKQNFQMLRKTFPNIFLKQSVPAFSQYKRYCQVLQDTKMNNVKGTKLFNFSINSKYEVKPKSKAISSLPSTPWQIMPICSILSL